MKRFLLLFIVFLPLALLYGFLEKHVGDNWLSVGIFCLVLVTVRLLFFLYERSRKTRRGRL